MKDHLENDNIVITGIAGKFPQCENVDEFKEALLNGVDLVTEENTRFPAGIWGIPKRSGIIPGIENFDASFFGIHPKQVNYMDPRHRMLLETVYECIFDAGYNPKEISGSKIGVYVGVSNYNNGQEYANSKTDGYFSLGSTLALASNRISFCFNLKGPSYSLETACSTSLYAFTNAIKDMNLGETDGAIVCAAHLIQNPVDSKEFNCLNMLSPDGKCKVFSTERNGYVRSETVSCFFLQRESTSRRIYATVRGAKCNADGFKTEGITFPSSEDHVSLLKDVYQSANIDPSVVSYVEAHGTGTIIGDIVESQAIVNHFCKKRKEPLLIGSVKSNMGHSEISAGMSSMVKVIIAMETGIIPKNLYTQPLDQTIPGIKDFKLMVLTENQKWTGGLVGVNSFGFGGANSHVILESHGKDKNSNIFQRYKNRLVHVSGRTEEAVLHLLKEIENNQEDPEFLALVDVIHKINIEGHSYRGYIVLGDQPTKGVAKYTKNRPLWFVYTGMGSQWNKMGKDLMHNAVFRKTINRCVKVLEPYDVDLLHIITDDDPKIFDNVCYVTTAIGCIEIALTDVLSSLGVIPDGICGHSFGEVGCAYADGQITVEQAVLLAYYRGYAALNAKTILGQMAAVGLSKTEISNILPEGIFVACQNGKTSVTIAGPKEATITFVDKLESQGIFAKLVNSANIAYHTEYVSEAGNLLLEFYKDVLKDPKPRSKKWISSSVIVNSQNEEWAQLNSPEYHYNNFCNPVLFDQVFKHIPENAIVVEVAPHGLLQAILKREMGQKTSHISLTNRSAEDNESFFLSAIGKIYLAGGQPNLRNMYNDVTFPVSRGTKMLSPLVKWDHNVSWFTGAWQHKSSYGKSITVSLSDEKYAHISGHEIDGRVLMNAGGYLMLVWETLAELHVTKIEELPVIIENVKFKRATVLTEGEDVKFLINIMLASGYFEISESGTITCTGMIRTFKTISSECILEDFPVTKNNEVLMTHKDVYKECQLRRYTYKGFFEGIIECNVKGLNGKLEWKGKFCTFIDTMFHMIHVSETSRDLMLLTSIEQLTIDPVKHLNMIQAQGFAVSFDPDLDVVKSGGIEMMGLNYSKVQRRQRTHELPYLESYDFVCYETTMKHQYDLDTSLRIAIQIVLQNLVGIIKQVKVCEVVTNENNESVNSSIKRILDQQAYTEAECFTSTLDDLKTKCDTIILSEAVLPFIKLSIVIKNLTDTGFILYKGNYSKICNNGLQKIFQSHTIEDDIYLLRPAFGFPKNVSVIHIRNSEFDWLEKLKVLSKTNKPQVVYVVSQYEDTSGIIGFVKCLLCEPTDLIFRSILIDHDANPFSVDSEFYRNQLKKNLTFNVLKQNGWGTFVHLPLKNIGKRNVRNATINISTVGDLSTLHWIEKPLAGIKISDQSEKVYVYYSALNVKDITAQTGFEYAGITAKGKRVMGLVGNESISLQTYTHPNFTWDVPKSWTLKDACTVPGPYAICYYSLILRGQLQPGESILIHAGIEAIGLAAINIALSMGCQVFTTVSNQEQRELLKSMFPKLEDKHIGSLKNRSFEKMVKVNTNGRGVDLVLHSLGDHSFQAFIKCLAAGGRFLKLGNVNPTISSSIPSSAVPNNITFHGINIDALFYSSSNMKHEIQRLLNNGIAAGVAKPLPSNIFDETEVELFSKCLASDKFKGNVIVEIRKEEGVSLTTPIRNVLAVPQVYIDSKKSYILVGGLGGVGLELADWLIRKGATKIILNSRNDVSDGHQAFYFRKWSNVKDVVVKINTSDSCNLTGTEDLIRFAQEFGPVGGIFNVALVLKDSLIPNQTKEKFEEVFKSKIISGQNMDTVSRKLCTDLDYFVVFSTICCGRGNIGQSNYGMANSALERLCEKRRREQLHGLAIQWGPIGEVGFFSKTEVIEENVLKDLLPQRVESCLDTLEKMMVQPCPVVSSVVLGNKNRSTKTQKVETPVETVAHILEIKNLDLIDKSLTLSQLGLDSLMLTKIKQTLCRIFSLELSPEEIRNITLGHLDKLGNTNTNNNKNSLEVQSVTPETTTYLLSNEAVCKMNNKNHYQKNIFLIHSAEGHVGILKPLAQTLKATVYGIECTNENMFDNIINFASYYNNKIREKQPKGPYCLCAYSYGCTLVTEMAIQLEKSKENVEIIYLEGSPSFVRNILKTTLLKDGSSVEKTENSVLKTFSSSFPKVNQKKITEKLKRLTSWKKKLEDISKLISKITGIDQVAICNAANAYFKRIMAGLNYEPSTYIEGRVLLIRVVENSFPSENYELDKICKEKVTVVKVLGTHETILLGSKARRIAQIIHTFLNV